MACAIELLLLRLGLWQLSRADEKQQYLVQMQGSVTNKKAINLSQINAASQKLEWASGRIYFLGKPVILLDNQRKDQQVGVTVYQLARNETQQEFLVDLGWLVVPGTRVFPKPDALHGEYIVSGLLLPAPAAGFALGHAVSSLDENRLLVTRIDIEALSKQLAKPLVSRVLRIDPSIAIGYERSLTVSNNTLPPEKHRAYAFQWFGLALAFLCLSLYVWKRRK
jgi:cytochrome oxidase assembly protein ShyY1